jgi:Fur family transcriptional regulator, zinc uptake regulator
MTHAHHHPPADMASAAKAAFETSGEQWTPVRAAVFDVLVQHPRPVGAYDIAEAVSRSAGRRIAPNTVYRILDLFVAKNLVNRIESRNAFIASAHPEHHDDCIFLVCNSCGAATHMDNPGIADQVRAAARATGFAPDKPVIEVGGQCGKCVAK